MLRDAAENLPEAAPAASSPVTRNTPDPEVGTSESVQGTVALPALDQVQFIEAAGGQVAFYSAVSPFKPTSNEDSICVLPVSSGCIVLGVADGLGGHRDGAQASQLVVSSLRRQIANHVLPLGLTLQEGSGPPSAASASLSVSPARLRTAILEAVESANEELLNNGGGSASTLALIELTGTRIRTYHVGDSAILVVGQRGRLKRQTVCHSPVGYALEAGLLDEEEALYHEERHVVSNVVGISDMRIELGPPLHLASRDTVLLATDGLYDNLWQDEIVEAIRKGPLQEGVHQLISLATRRMLIPEPGHPSKPDDLSVVAFRLKPPKRKRRSRKKAKKSEAGRSVSEPVRVVESEAELPKETSNKPPADADSSIVPAPPAPEDSPSDPPPTVAAPLSSDVTPATDGQPSPPPEGGTPTQDVPVQDTDQADSGPAPYWP